MPVQVDPPSHPRFQEMHPTFAAADIERMRRRGEPRTYADGEKLLAVGKVAPGAYVVLAGHVAVTERDGFGHVTPIADQGPGPVPRRGRPAFRRARRWSTRSPRARSRRC